MQLDSITAPKILIFEKQTVNLAFKGLQEIQITAHEKKSGISAVVSLFIQVNEKLQIIDEAKQVTKEIMINYFASDDSPAQFSEALL